jgi:hypothetical protein
MPAALSAGQNFASGSEYPAFPIHLRAARKGLR